jgi:hypothetical protein
MKLSLVVSHATQALRCFTKIGGGGFVKSNLRRRL